MLDKIKLGFPGDSDGKQSACDRGDPVSIPESERSSGKWKGYPLQYSCLENPMDRRPCWAISMGSQRVRHDWVTNTHTQNKLKMENNPEVVEQVNGYTRVYSLSKRNSSQPEKGTNYWFRKQKWVKCIFLTKSYMGCDILHMTLWKRQKYLMKTTSAIASNWVWRKWQLCQAPKKKWTRFLIE